MPSGGSVYNTATDGSGGRQTTVQRTAQIASHTAAMKLLIVLCLLAVALARPERNAQVVSNFNELREDNSYDFQFETSNNILREESGLSYPGNEPETGRYVQTGSYEFVHPDGTVTSIQFIADENGFRPLGAVIPQITEQVNIQDA
ncbi:cuticle protein CP14.6-like [Amphibalanus amphitrite]|uniref:cuticle protein CP14.6-like n=1 Tax=Amphibalanus amphitrite TaxID=1232801 RepID=UPI001C921176|nr:cuticle protein CP14.6-like [Amphibalanus amphitrite]